MDLLEHQGKELMAAAGLPVPRGEVAGDPDAAREAAARLGGRVMVKAQVRTGGRGKAGGVRAAAGPEEAAEAAADILALQIRGFPVEAVLVEEAAAVSAEIYCAVALDRSARAPVAIVSARGGVDIEELAASDPGAVARRRIDPLLGLMPFEVRGLTRAAGVTAAAASGVGRILQGLYRMMWDLDALLIEVNPVIFTGEAVLAGDAKVSLDDAALFRHPELARFSTPPSGPQEAMAAERGLKYLKLDGNIGIIGNGAGLVMATLDLVAWEGGRPANFCDVGGGAGADELAGALEVILVGGGVASVLVNIFGGITRCDLVARGILAALERARSDVPVVVRLDGTNAEEGRRILNEAKSPSIVEVGTMLEAAAKAAELAA